MIDDWKAMALLLVIGLAIPSMALAEPDDDPPMEGLTGGDMPWEKTFDEALLEGRDHYNVGDFEAAADAFVRAIQTLPEQAAPYRNLARSYNHMGKFGAATEYYDIYLRLVPEADDAETITAERRGAMSRAGDEAWRRPADQTMALRALNRELADGRALTEDDGGAWGLYRTLLDVGYADPNLDELRSTLRERLIGELESNFEREDDFLPLLDEHGWRLQKQRVDAVRQLTRSDDYTETLELLDEVVDVGIWLVEGDYEQAANGAGRFIDGDQAFGFVGWYKVVALERLEKPAEALDALERVQREEIFEQRGARRIEAVRARLLQQLGEVEQATDAYYDLLRSRP